VRAARESQPHIQLSGRRPWCCNFLASFLDVGFAGSLDHSHRLSGSDPLQGSPIVTNLTAMASDSAELRIASPSAQPLLHNHLTSDFDISRARSPREEKDFSTVTERALEDGDTSDSDSDTSLGPHPTFWGRCLMAVRRRRPSLSRADHETGRLPAFEKRRRAWRAKKYVWRKRDGAWGCLGLVGFVVFFL
jgi:hypothetical protein